MPNRTERRAAERAARKLATKQLQAQTSAGASAAQSILRQLAPISAAQLSANQQNAQRSTGPTSSEGKAISARNNTRHGLASDNTADGFRVLRTEDQNAYDQDLIDFRAEWKPVTATEHDLVNRMVMHQWLRRRALRLQEQLFSPETGEITEIKKFELYRRYETSHERGFNKAFADMQRLRAFQMRERNGFESQTRKNEEHAFKMQRLQHVEDRKNGTQTSQMVRTTATQPVRATVTAP